MMYSKEILVQKGRSMVEMLGVLCVICVLSIGGIAGFSKAMEKFKTNKTISQLSYLVTNVRTIFGSHDSYAALGTTTNINMLKKAKMIPESMIKTQTVNNEIQEVLVNPFKGGISLIYSDLYSQGDQSAFLVVMNNIPKDSCITMATQDWGTMNSSGMVVFGVNQTATAMAALHAGCSSSASADSAYVCAKDKNVSQTKTALTVPEAAAACLPNGNVMSWKYF